MILNCTPISTVIILCTCYFCLHVSFYIPIYQIIKLIMNAFFYTPLQIWISFFSVTSRDIHIPHSMKTYSQGATIYRVILYLCSPDFSPSVFDFSEKKNCHDR
uniref:Uncharacterized protein n=1 Tax=Cacopsylla melanoneura TaxID=428564 RepID=A0A8D8Y932_9HEMI